MVVCEEDGICFPKSKDMGSYSTAMGTQLGLFEGQSHLHRRNLQLSWSGHGHGYDQHFASFRICEVTRTKNRTVSLNLGSKDAVS